jgi:DNA-binding response OmpR family regulator
VLYINGDAETRILLSRIARRWHGVRLMTSETGQEGRHLTLTLRPSLILLDDHLSDLDSHDLLAQIRQDLRTATTPVVVLSANPSTHGPFTRAGATAWFTKPLHIANVERTTKGLLELADRH